MSTLYVRDVPDELMGRLRERAAKERRSMAAEVVTILERALQDQVPRRNVAQILEDMRRRRDACTPPAGAPDSLELLREDRAR